MPPTNDDLKAVLTDADRELLESYSDDPGLFEQIGGVFRGRLRLLTAISVAFSFAIFAISVWCLVELLNAESAVGAVRWAVGFLWCSMAVAMLKIWFWMQMNEHRLLRDIKRLELRLSGR